ncbi:MAG TPA: ATP-binding protein [Cyclobacteriaceae bacterium]|nr:ATP-binding protein [Cyclobacteriaceae bacterium]
MKIKKLQIKNFKSLVDFELEDLKPFCAFVGPNASGKSNIFEALEFTNYVIRYQNEAPGFFNGLESIFSYQSDHNSIYCTYEFDNGILIHFVGQGANSQNRFTAISSAGKESMNPLFIRNIEERKRFVEKWEEQGNRYQNEYEQFADNFSRIFVGKSLLNRIPAINSKLSPDASNLSQMIGLIFQDEETREDFIEWLRVLIPEFRNIEVKKSNIDSSYDFLIYEKGSAKPFPKHLISDGTYNILSLMAAVYQTNQPQFLCIEEPENGLHPQAIELLVDFFREKCEEEGHHIWLNTHSQTLVRCLDIDEIILINKIDGATHAKQLTKADEVNIKTDEAWLTNALGGGVLWSK